MLEENLALQSRAVVGGGIAANDVTRLLGLAGL